MIVTAMVHLLLLLVRFLFLSGLEQKVGCELLVLVTEHVSLKDHLTVEAELLELPR